MKGEIVFGLIILTCLMQDSVQAQKNIAMIITGNVKDSITGDPIIEATVSASDVSDIRTDRGGNFKVVVTTSNPIFVKVNKEGYIDFEKLLEPQEKVELTTRLIPEPLKKIEIMMTSFKSNSVISGQVEGLSPSEYKDYKVLVYVLTDKWYIHPWAENAEGRGFASIKNDSTRTITTVWRGYQAYRVAFLLTRRSTYPPPIVEITSRNPDQKLLSKINSVAHLIIEAPVGI